MTMPIRGVTELDEVLGRGQTTGPVRGPDRAHFRAGSAVGSITTIGRRRACEFRMLARGQLRRGGG